MNSRTFAEKQAKSRRVWQETESQLDRNAPDFNSRWAEMRRSHYSIYGAIATLPEDTERLRPLYNKYRGERIFIMGNGPSLNQTPLEKLENEFTFGLNRIHLLFDRISWRPTFFTINDWRVGGDTAHEINALDGMTFFFPERFRGLLREGEDVYWFWQTPFIAMMHEPHERYFPQDLLRGSRGAGSVTGTAIQIAYHLGFDPIYLIGVDASYQVLPTVTQSGPDRFGDGVLLYLESTKDDDPNHFDPRYFGKGRKWHNPNVPAMLEGYQRCRAGANMAGRRIINATVGGKLEIFPRANIHEILDSPQALPGHEASDYLIGGFSKEARCFLSEAKTLARFFAKYPPTEKSSPSLLDIAPAPDPDSPQAPDPFAHYKWRTQRHIAEPKPGPAFFEKSLATQNNGQELTLLHLGDGVEAEAILKAFPWETVPPRSVLCPFENAATATTLGTFLQAQGYHVYISEWHPKVYEHIRHDWRGLKAFPANINDTAWGRLVAFRYHDRLPEWITTMLAEKELHASEIALDHKNEEQATAPRPATANSAPASAPSKQGLRSRLKIDFILQKLEGLLWPLALSGLLFLLAVALPYPLGLAVAALSPVPFLYMWKERAVLRWQQALGVAPSTPNTTNSHVVALLEREIANNERLLRTVEHFISASNTASISAETEALNADAIVFEASSSPASDSPS